MAIPPSRLKQRSQSLLQRAGRSPQQAKGSRIRTREAQEMPCMPSPQMERDFPIGDLIRRLSKSECPKTRGIGIIAASNFQSNKLRHHLLQKARWRSACAHACLSCRCGSPAIFRPCSSHIFVDLLGKALVTNARLPLRYKSIYCRTCRSCASEEGGTGTVGVCMRKRDSVRAVPSAAISGCRAVTNNLSDHRLPFPYVRYCTACAQIRTLLRFDTFCSLLLGSTLPDNISH